MAHKSYKEIGSPAMRIIEECGEILQATMKGERFGWFNFHPEDPEQRPNIELLQNEVYDLMEALKDLERRQGEEPCKKETE